MDNTFSRRDLLKTSAAVATAAAVAGSILSPQKVHAYPGDNEPTSANTRKPLPPLAHIRQKFPRPKVDDPVKAMGEAFAKLKDRIKPGQKVGILVGSRGINNLNPMLKVVVDGVKAQKATPVFMAAMGSHGGGTAAGQKEVLDSLGITESNFGIKVICCDECRHIGETPDGLKAYVLESAFQVDAIIPINRVKTHTSFKGAVESGMCKMLVVGLGGPMGAAQFHSLGQSELPRLLVEVSKIIMEKTPVIGGIAIVENGYEETAKLQAVLPENFVESEIELLKYSKSLMPSLPLDNLHGLIVEEMGKNFSGTGIDTNIIGRLRITGEKEMESPFIKYISVLDITEASHGNAIGIGLADFTTEKLIKKIDRKPTYLNNLTTTFVTRGFFPMFFDTEQDTVETMMFCLRSLPLDQVKIVQIPNTLFLTDCLVSQAVLEECKKNPDRFEILEEPKPVTFDAQGNLVRRLSGAH